MVGFHPAQGRVISHDDVDMLESGTGNHKSHATNANEDVEDEIESDFSSDFDQPYHETASHWYDRHSRRRARRLAGISSSSSSSSSSDECSSLDSDSDGNDNGNDGGGGRSKRMKEMDKAAWSANRPLTKWLASYPLVAARCCLSMPSTMTMDTSKDYGKTTARRNNSHSTLPAGERETKRLRRLFRRLNRKQKEFQAKFTPKNGTSGCSGSSYHQTFNSLSAEQTTAINQESMETRNDPLAIQSFVPQGTGISFIDAVLARDSHLQSKSGSESIRKQPQTASRLVLELNGPPRTGMTSILLAVAARYVASTSNIFLGIHKAAHHGKVVDIAGECHPPMKRRRRNDYSIAPITEPRVVILDLEKGVHAVKLVLSVREAVLRRWEETAAARKWKREQAKQWRLDGAGAEGLEGNGDNYNNTMEEQHQINHAIMSCLGRIHVVQPRDFTYLSLVATIEVLRQSLDMDRTKHIPIVDKMIQPSPQFFHPKQNGKPQSPNPNTQQQPPTLMLIDSLTTLDASTRFQESLPTSSSGSNRSSGGSGLSDRNEFYRQLIRLRDDHEIAILGASRSVATSVNNRTNDQGGVAMKRGGNTLWEKMVSHRVSLHHVAEGTNEERAGYDFVATLNGNGNHQEDSRVFPYSVTAGGIASC